MGIYILLLLVVIGFGVIIISLDIRISKLEHKQ